MEEAKTKTKEKEQKAKKEVSAETLAAIIGGSMFVLCGLSAVLGYGHGYDLGAVNGYMADRQDALNNLQALLPDATVEEKMKAIS